jgi:hypothetical protein
MRIPFKDSNPAAVLLSLALLGLIFLLILPLLMVPLFIALAMCGLSVVLVVVSLRSQDRRFSIYALCTLGAWPLLLVWAWPLSGSQRQPLPPTVRIEGGLSKAEAESMYGLWTWAQRQTRWHFFWQDVRQHHLNAAWSRLHTIRNPPFWDLERLTENADGSVTATVVHGQVRHQTALRGKWPSKTEGTNAPKQ